MKRALLPLIVFLSACSGPLVQTPVGPEKGSEKVSEAALVKALNSSDLGPLQEFLQQKGNINQLLEGKQPALHLLVQANNLVGVKQLLERGADINVRDSQSRTALFLTTSLQMLELLLERGADPNLADKYDFSPLKRFISQGSLTFVKRMLAKGATIDPPGPLGVRQLSPLFQTITPGMFKLLVESGARLDGRDSNGNTLMHFVEDPELIQILVDKGLAVDLPDNDDHSSLSECFQPAKAQRLLNLGARVDLVDRNGNTPLHRAAQDGRFEIFSLMVDHLKSNLHAQSLSELLRQENTPGYTTLHLAARSGSLEIIERLLKLGVDINQPSLTQGTPLLESIRAVKPAAALKLLEAGADPNLALEQRTSNPATSIAQSPLLIAVKTRQLELSRQLLARKADPDFIDDLGRNALNYAAENFQIPLVQLLAEAGTDPNLPGEKGRTPLQLVLLKGHAELLRLLIAKGANVSKRDLMTFERPLETAIKTGRLDLIKAIVESGKLANPLSELEDAQFFARSRKQSDIEVYLDERYQIELSKTDQDFSEDSD